MTPFFSTEIEYLKGVGPQKALLLQQELQIFTFSDLIQHYPFRYEDHTRFYQIRDLHEDMPHVQLKGTIGQIQAVGLGKKKRLTAAFKDETGSVTLVWFRGLAWVMQKIKPGVTYALFGKPTIFGRQFNFVHPDLEVLTPAHTDHLGLRPVYSVTEKLKNKFLDSKAIAKLQNTLWQDACTHIKETLSPYILSHYQLMPRHEALPNIHFPKNNTLLQQARLRLKFEELFFIQLRLLKLRNTRIERLQGQPCRDTNLLKKFYHTGLPFALTNAQKKVSKEIYHDLCSGHQMNRLLQGDVGSGKTMVAFLSMLMAIGSKAQATIMAPTEILAEQHYHDLQKLAKPLHITIALLTGATKKKTRAQLYDALNTGYLNILVGTHALLQENVQFKNLGLAVIDEQHRFGVTQRAKLWQKNAQYPPHILVMTATPIPRTLAMTLYGDLDVSVIDEMPLGRKPIKTSHYYDANRLRVFQFLKEQIQAGRQVYIVYPLIEESKKMDYKDLMDGYESICRAFPKMPISIMHGQMKAHDKTYEMQRFVQGATKIMVATTVIEVGVNVPNATVMVVENAERFGLAQLHQLRGRVGRGAAQSYCILMTGYKVGADSKKRIQTMVQTNDGFEIANIDLQIRGPGDLLGVQQSGLLELKIADLGKDEAILRMAREAAQQVLQENATLTHPKNKNIKAHLDSVQHNTENCVRVG